MIVELLRSGQSVRFVARGASMWPALPSRSLLEVQPCPAAELAIGEVAAFECRGRVIVHRLARVSPAGLHFRGDNRSRPDAPVAPSAVLGRVRVLERRGLHWRWPQRGELGRALRSVLRRFAPSLLRVPR